MKRIFHEWGGTIVVLVAIVAVIGLVSFLIKPTGAFANALGSITDLFYNKTASLTATAGMKTVPTGGMYYVGVASTTMGDYSGATETYSAGDVFPEALNEGDVYVYGDYEYRYNQSFTGSRWSENTAQDGWGVRVLDTTKSEYGEILDDINGKSITSLEFTFSECICLVSAPKIPSSVTSLQHTFYCCSLLSDISGLVIPNSVTNMSYTFARCFSLRDASSLAIPSSVKNLYYAFSTCQLLTKAPKIPSGVTDISGMFASCRALTDASGIEIPNTVTNMLGTFNSSGITKAPEIPDSVTNMNYTFANCESLTTAPKIPAGVTDISQLFQGCSSLKTYAGSLDADGDFSKYVLPEGIYSLWRTFVGCSSITAAPVIPSSVYTLGSAFSGCTALTGSVTVNATSFSNYSDCFKGTQITEILGSCPDNIKEALLATK